MNQFMGVMMDPFIAGRGEGQLPAATHPLTPKRKRWPMPQEAQSERRVAAIYTKAPPVVPFQQRWSVWAAAFGGSQTTDGNTAVGSNTATSRIYGTAIGADYRFSPFTIAGFSLAGGGTNFSVANNGTGRSDLFQAGAFIRHNIGAAYLSGALAYGWQDVTTDRNVTVAGIDQLRARFNANAWSGRVEGGYRFVAPVAGGIGFTPYAAGQFTTFELPAYAEGVISGANTFALAYGARSVTDTRSELGLRTDKSYAMSVGILTLRGRVAWAHDFNPGSSIGATFQTLPGATFVVGGAAQASEFRAGHRLRREEMAERLVRRRHVRRRVLQCHSQLRRQGRRAVCVVRIALPVGTFRTRRDIRPKSVMRSIVLQKSFCGMRPKFLEP